MTTASFFAGKMPTPSAVTTQAGDASAEWRWGGGVVIGLLIVAGAWAGFARLDSAVSAPGAVKVAGDRRAIQSLEGGVISSLDVVEGQKVAKGQVLVQFATSLALAQERSLAVRVIGLQAQIARLDAESAGASAIAVPAAFAGLMGQDRAEADRALAMARSEMLVNAAADQNQAALLGQRAREIGDQIAGHAQRKIASVRQIDLSRQELDGIQALAAKGYASKNRVLALQRTVAALEGDAGGEQAEMARLHSSTLETRLQLIQLRGDKAAQRAQDLRAAQTELQSLLPQWHAAAEALARTQLRAPVAGTVMGLSVRGAGAVAGPGQRLMDIVPRDRSLVVDAQIGVGDVNDLAPGMGVDIRVTGLHGRNNPILHGTLSRLSADSFSDEKTGRAFYTASFRVPASELRKLESAASLRGSIRPGTPVVVQVPLHQRTALQYWFEPLTEALTGALHER